MMESVLKLVSLLANYRNTVLLAFCKHHGLVKANAPKAELITVLGAALTRRDHVRAAVAALDPAALAALHTLQRAARVVDHADWLELLLDAGTVEPPPKRTNRWGPPASGRFDLPGSRAFHDVVARLEVQGLALGTAPSSGLSVIDPGTALRYCIPTDVRPHLPPAPPTPPLPPPAMEAEARGDAADYQRRLFFLWSFVDRRQPTLLASGLIAKRELKALGDELGLKVDWKTVKSEADLGIVSFDRLLLMEIGLIRERQGTALEGVDDAAADWWSWPFLRRARHCLDVYLKAQFWNELEHLPGVAWQRGSAPYGGDGDPSGKGVAAARAAVVDRLRALAGGGDWIGVPALMRDLKATRRSFLIEPGTPRVVRYAYTYMPDHPYTGANNRQGWTFSPVLDHADGWQKVEGGFVRQVLATLGRMGLMDLGYGEDRALVAVRLTPLGRHLVAGAKAPPAADAAGVRVVVQPNFQIVAFGPVPEATLFEIEQFAERVSADRALTYALTRASVYRGQQRGWDSGRVLRRLAELSGAEAPQNVARSVVEWQALHDRIVVRTGLPVIQAHDAGLLDQIERAGGSGMIERLAPDLALAVRPGSDGLGLALSKLDIHPRQVAGTVDGVAGTLALDEEGRVALRHKTPDLATLGWLQKLAIPEGDARTWRVTAASARRAQQRLGMDAEAQVKVWQRLSTGQLPAALVVRLKAWTGHYGAARRVEGVVLELPSDQALSELHTHPDLKGALKALRPKGPLVVVASEDFARVVERMRDLGLDVPGAE